MNDITKEELAEFYKSHSNQETADFLGVSKSQLLRILAKREIPKKVAYKKHNSVNDTIDELLTRIDINQYKADAKILTQKQLCEKYGILNQRYVNRSDIQGGSTLGTIVVSQLPIRMLDIGVPILAMHSARETMGIDDQYYLEKIVEAFYKEV